MSKDCKKKKKKNVVTKPKAMPSNCLFYFFFYFFFYSSKFSFTLIKIKAANPDEVEDVTTELFFWLSGIKNELTINFLSVYYLTTRFR